MTIMLDWYLFSSPFFWVLSSLLTFVLMMAVLQGKIRHKFVIALLTSLTEFFCVFGAICAWALRDGLGPDSVSSFGMTGFMSFLKLFAVFSLPGVVTALLLAGFCIKQNRL